VADKENIEGNKKFPPIVRLLYPLYISTIQIIRTNPLFIRLLFKTRLPKGGKVSWDFTTSVLKHALKRTFHSNFGNDKSVLEIGVGQAALLCIYLFKKFGVISDGIDIIQERVNSSLFTAKYNSVNLRIWKSDFFEQVEKKYHLIFWNASYIPTSFGREQYLSGREGLGDQRAWDGGNDGTQTLQRFLEQAPLFLKPNGKIMLGVNRFYVSEKQVLRIVESHQLLLIKRITRPFNPSTVYIMRKK